MKSIFSLCAVSVVLAFASNVNGSIETGDTFAANSTLSTAAVQDAYIIKLRPGNQLAQFSAQGNGLMPSRQKLTSEQLKRLQDDERVEYVEPQQIMRIAAIQNNPPSWGLPRVSNRRSGVGQAYNYPNSAGAGTEIWVIDTGVYAEHKDFGGRAKMVKSFIDGEPAIDLNGHGTHVAGTTAGTTYGLAKKAKIFGVKVLSGSGSGSNAGVIAGIQYATRYARRYKSVINMSLSGGKSRAVDDAVNAAVNAGVAVVVAAGNSATDS
ncbi:peptidase S8/S53 domain-containing protein [Syncephalis fuscata]|nr:peptidase S8/S53 domain-containing protein [Syncephalis fuscata]